MTTAAPTAVDGLKQRLLDLSKLDDDGVYRHGPDKRKARTAMVMDALRDLWAEAAAAVDLPAGTQGVGLACVGSLARGQIGPCSDLDLVIIYEEHAIKLDKLSKLADKLWYPLWDSGVDLDHSVRTKAQCESVTDKDLPAVVGWLDVVPIAGDTDLIKRTAVSILERWRKAARKRLPELGESAEARLDQFGRLPYIGQPDVKEARGGLRDSVLISALAASWLADRPHGRYDDAVERLLDVRDCLHLASHKDTDLLRADYQPKVAAMLGLADPTKPEEQRAAESIDYLLTLLARLGRQVAFAFDATYGHAQHALVHEKPRFGFFQIMQPRGHGKREAPTFELLAPGVAKHEGEVVLAPGVDPTEPANRDLPLRVASAAAEHDMRISPVTLQNIARCPVKDTAWDEDSRAMFVRLLACSEELVETWEELDYVDMPARWIPEWAAIRNRPSASSAHRFTIDRHMVEVTSKLGRTAPTGERYDDEHYRVLLLAGILHDIGKRPGVNDHAAEGARHARAILERMGFDAATVDAVVLLVREHLTLSDWATKRSPDDESALRELGERVGDDPLMLDMLFDLTRADSSSLGSTPGEILSKTLGWSKWRESLVTMMYSAARRQLGK